MAEDIAKLGQLMRELEARLSACMRCGMCRSVCPVFAETGREPDVARGKLALLDALMREMLRNPQAVNERLERCLLCGSCAANCPNGVNAPDIFLRARALLAGFTGLSPVKKAVFRKMLVRPEIFNRLVRSAGRLQHLVVEPADELLDTSRARFMSPLGERHIKRLAPVPFHDMAGGLVDAGIHDADTKGTVDTPAGASGVKVAFFPGCLIDNFFPEAGKAVLKTLHYHGIGVFIPRPGSLACCGLPALSAGDVAAFATLVRHNLRLFSSGPSFDRLITGCATCTYAIKRLWPSMAVGLSSDELDAVRSLSERTMDVSQFLVDDIGIRPSAPEEGRGDGDGNAQIVTYHDPCHLKRSLGVASQPRTLIRANPAYRFREMDEADRCCGCGGSFNLSHYDISAAIGMCKRENIARSGCAVVATSCPACMLQVSDMLSRAGDRIRVRHVMEIYAESLP